MGELGELVGPIGATVTIVGSVVVAAIVQRRRRNDGKNGEGDTPAMKALESICRGVSEIQRGLGLVEDLSRDDSYKLREIERIVSTLDARQQLFAPKIHYLEEREIATVKAELQGLRALIERLIERQQSA